MACPKCGSEKVKYTDELPPVFMELGDFSQIACGGVTCARCGTRLGEAGEEEVDLIRAQLYFRNGVATGRWFRAIRQALKFRAQDLAKLLQVRAETISHWETRKDAPIDVAPWIAIGALLEDCIACRTTMYDRLLAVLNPTPPTKPAKISAPIGDAKRVFPGTTPIPKSRPRAKPPAPPPTPPGIRAPDLKETQTRRSQTRRFAKSARTARRRPT